MDERVGEVVLVARLEMMRQEGVVLAVDAGAHHELDAGLLSDARGEARIAREVHARRVDDRAHAVPHRAADLLDGARELLVLVVQVRVLRADGLARRQQVLMDRACGPSGSLRSARRSSRSVAPRLLLCLRRTGPTLTMRSAEVGRRARVPIGRFERGDRG